MRLQHVLSASLLRVLLSSCLLASSSDASSHPLRVSCGVAHSCAALASGVVRCWGDNRDGQLGDGSSRANSSAPTSVTGISDATEVRAGAHHTCALLSTGAVRCWGRNDHGQLGDGTAGDDSPVPVPVVGISTAARLALGTSHSCALLLDGTAKCWGKGSDGQLGDGASASSAIPVLATPPTSSTTSGTTTITYADLTAGGDRTCALLHPTGDVACWGDYQVQIAGAYDASSPTSVFAPTSPATVVAVAAANRMTCATLSDGTARCWGAVVGQVWGPSNDGARVSDAAGAAFATLVGGPGEFACATTATNGTVKCFGSNQFGQFGDGTVGGSYEPAWAAHQELRLSGSAAMADAAAAVAPGAYHACAAATDGETVRCWGRNANGELGDGTTDDRSTPGRVVGLVPSPPAPPAQTHTPTQTPTNGGDGSNSSSIASRPPPPPSLATPPPPNSPLRVLVDDDTNGDVGWRGGLCVGRRGSLLLLLVVVALSRRRT